MKYRKAKKSSHQTNLGLVTKQDRTGLAACFAVQERTLSPLPALVQDASEEMKNALTPRRTSRKFTNHRRSDLQL